MTRWVACLCFGWLVLAGVFPAGAQEAPAPAAVPAAAEPAAKSPVGTPAEPAPENAAGVEKAADAAMKRSAIHFDRLGEKVLEDTAAKVSGRLGGRMRRRYMGIELWRYAYCLIVLLAAFLASYLFTGYFLRYGIRVAERTHTEIDDMIFRAAIRPSRIVIQAVGVYLAFMPLLLGAELPPALIHWFGRLCLAVAAGAVFWYAYHLVDVADHYMRRFAERTDNDFDNGFVDVLRKTLRMFVIALGVLFIGRYILNWDITALLASAGIVGLAVAFAAQDTIANLFGTVMLLLDRPLRVGERVIIEGAEGPVESVGFRSTRVRTLDGNLVAIPNKTVANTKIENVGRRPFIKRVSTIGVTYDTPCEKVRRAVEIIREILADHEGMDPEYPPRVHFAEFNAYSLDIVMIAWYHPAEYWEYLRWCEEVNFRIMKAFEEEKIEFAFPTSTTYLAGDPNRPLNLVNPAAAPGGSATARRDNS